MRKDGWMMLYREQLALKRDSVLFDVWRCFQAVGAAHIIHSIATAQFVS